ncbi:Asp23/Gls24 family envelope stress response protein [Lactovum miscens]|uniref:Putative alkaline shock family protein YloU n=1 Tax=Lactovum miscens TaxID=190387 RepID=A0A841C7Y7_9LACT|nr:Asp23/Gls24 family envelope stress response protein [Lactovum miscens]MBB5888464.1 putative alkaline shock family protein YloU [Lactovum miscens]
MPVTFRTANGEVEISTEVIATVVGTSTTEIFGVVGMTSQNAVRDNVRQILGQDNYSRGVVVNSDVEGTTIDVFVVISYGVKISEVARNIQERVCFNLENQLGLTNVKVNVNVESVKVVNE